MESKSTDTPTIFLNTVVGEEGAKALSKATKYTPIASALVPRAIVGWLLSKGGQVNEQIPGVPNSHLTLYKTENSLFSGTVSIGEHTHAFVDENFVKAAAVVAVALGVDSRRIDPRIRKTDLSNLGQSIDHFIKTEAAKNLYEEETLIKKVLDPNEGYTFTHKESPEGNYQIKITAHAPNGARVGSTVMYEKEGQLVPASVVVNKEHRRKGIASAMYALAEQKSNKRIRPSLAQTQDGKFLWEGNKEQKQFGKSEYLRNRGNEPLPTKLYRGITQEEFDYIKQKGHILSNQKWCLPGEGTCFGEDKATAESYVNYGQTDPKITKKPTYVIEIDYSPDIKQWKDGYWKTNNPIPANKITKVWRYNPDESFDEEPFSKTVFEANKGKPHQATAPKPPDTPQATQQQRQFVQRKQQPRTAFSFKKSEMDAAKCFVCGQKEFIGAQFTGCACLKDLAKAGDFSVTEKNGSYVFQPGNSWGLDSITKIVQTVKGAKK